jgi:hypothetical protein
VSDHVPPEDAGTLPEGCQSSQTGPVDD